MVDFRYVLDTSVCIDLLRGDPEALGRLTSIPPGQYAVSHVVLAELFYGAYRTAPERIQGNLQAVRRMAEGLSIVGFTVAQAELFGRIKSELAARGTPIPDTDIQIACAAIDSGVPLVTSDLAHFASIRGLEVVDWRSWRPGGQQ